MVSSKEFHEKRGAASGKSILHTVEVLLSLDYHKKSSVHVLTDNIGFSSPLFNRRHLETFLSARTSAHA